jgi:Ca2+-binding RTX toxin-like protein
MADEMITIDASALDSIDYAQYLKDYFSTVGTVAGQTNYYGGEYSANVAGYFSGSQFGVRYSATTNDKQVVMQGSNIEYDGVDGVHHGAYSGDVDSITFGSYDENTTFTQGDNNGPRSELSGVIAGLVVSNLDISTPFGTAAGPDNAVKTLMDELKNAGVETDGVKVNIDALYALFSSRAQHFIGSSGDDSYVGTAFGDLIEGGAGFDTLAGGLGDDTYVVTDRNNNVLEYADGGTDTIETGITHYQIRENIENLIQTGTVADQWNYGNALGNTMTTTDLGGSLLGMEGDDTLIGGLGNDYLSGDQGVDVMTGGKGNDTYSVDDFADTVNENAGEGRDTVETTLNHCQIGDAIENLTQTGDADMFGYGNDKNNVMIGNDGASTLLGFGGNDMLNGGAGADTLYGYAGNDTYIVDNLKDQAIERDPETNVDDGGKDTVRSYVNYTIGDFIENLALLNSIDPEKKTANLKGTGNALDNRITGNEADNKLFGLGGEDIIRGGAGNDKIRGGLGTDTLAGNAGADTFYFNTGDTAASRAHADTIRDFHLKQGDLINLHAMDANEDKNGNQNFKFIDNDAFSHHAGELRFEKTGHGTTIMGDTDGDGKADFTIHLDASVKVTEDFFAL